MPRPAPPPPKKPHTVLKVVRAIYPYLATRSDEVSFEEGEQLYILSEPEEGWYRARVGHPERGSSGLVPANYVEEHTETVQHPLHEAAKRGNLEHLTDCLANQVSVNGLDYAGATPLHWAAAGGYMECLEALLRQPKVLLDVQNKLGDTPLHQAAWKGRAACVGRLLAAAARSDIQNKEHKTPGSLARDPETAALLRHSARGLNNGDDYIDENAAEDSD